MVFRMALPALVALLFGLRGTAQNPELSKAVQEFVRVNAHRVVLTHVRILDGTGAPAVDDQNLVIEGGKILSIEKGADVSAAAGVTALDLRGDAWHYWHAQSPLLHRATQSRWPAAL